MASIRTLKFNKVPFKWDTGKLQSLVFTKERVESTYNNLLYPKLSKLDSYETIRKDILSIVSSLISDSSITTMEDMVYCLLTLKLTLIDFSKNPISISLTLPNEESGIPITKIMFWNIALHINAHCRQLKWICKIRVIRPFDDSPIGLCYSGAECDDIDDTFEYTKFQNDFIKYKKLQRKSDNK